MWSWGAGKGWRYDDGPMMGCEITMTAEKRQTSNGATTRARLKTGRPRKDTRSTVRLQARG